MPAIPYRSAVIATVVLIPLGWPAATLGDDGAEDVGGLASEMIPPLSRNRDLNDTEVSLLDRALRGQTECEVTLLLGQPDEVDRLSRPDVHLRYRFGRELLSVAIRNGRVSSVDYGERQTGVRDDDLVGVIGP
ncbi:MAG TPA: hypothetical protein VKD90_28445 [Gemmataceae bacterium]|nr:hypothetical protein [Gemmataceae bacterium]